VNPKDEDEFRGENAMNPPKVREDPYYWLRDDTRKKTEVLDHLKAENAYAENQTAHLQGLRDDLYDEMLSHLKETDEDVPHRDNDFFYYSKTVQGKSYKIHCRKSLHSEEETVVIDENKLAEGHEYSDMSTYSLSPSHTKVAYTIDHSGYETYDVRFVNDIASGLESADVIKDVDGDITWGADDTALFYLKMDEEHRPHKIFMHIVGTDQAEDVCLYTEEDQMFWMQAGKTADDKFLVINTESKETSEVYVINLQGVKGAEGHRRAVENKVCIKPREFGVRYDVEHHEGKFCIITNADGAKNNKLAFCPVSNYFEADTGLPVDPSVQHFSDLKTYKPSEQIDEIIPFKDYIAVFGREDGIQRLWIVNQAIGSAGFGKWIAVPFSEVSYSLWAGDNCVYDCKTLRLGYSSLLTPKQVLDYNMETGEMEVLKQVEVPLYQKDNYECRRIFATARDGAKVPLNLVYNKKVLAQGGQLQDRPVLLYGYGSYGACIDPSFDFKRLSLLDRGVVYVIANIRGI
jgi:oligopeptidase B